MSTGYNQAVDAFLNQIGTSIFSPNMLNRIWKAFMAYSLCIVAQAFAFRGYAVTAENCAAGFSFKCFPAGNPSNYSFFKVSNGKDEFELRLSVDCQNLQFNSIKLNMDVVVLTPNSLGQTGIVNAELDLVSFAECKNLRGFPELVATVEGMAFELQRPRVWNSGAARYRIPCCLLVSGPGTTIINRNTVFVNRGYSVRIYHMIRPGSAEVQRFIQTWF